MNAEEYANAITKTLVLILNKLGSKGLEINEQQREIGGVKYGGYGIANKQSKEDIFFLTTKERKVCFNGKMESLELVQYKQVRDLILKICREQYAEKQDNEQQKNIDALLAAAGLQNG